MYQLWTCVKGYDDLAFVGKPLDSEDFTDQTLAGLSEAVNGRYKLIFFSELHANYLILRWWYCTETTSVPTVPTTANAAGSRPKQQRDG